MNRRAFVTGLGAVLAAPLGVEAQQFARTARIGFLETTSVTSPETYFRLLEHLATSEESEDSVI